MTDPTPTEPVATDPPPADPVVTDPAPTTPPAGEDPKPEEPLGDTGIKALQAERDARKQAEKLAADHAAKLKEYEDAQLSEKERLEKERDEAREVSAENARKVALYEAAVEYGLEKGDLELLDGVPADQIDARAKRLAERLAAVGPKTPKPDPTQGGRNGAGTGIDAQIEEAQRAGDFRKVISLQNQKLAEQISAS